MSALTTLVAQRVRRNRVTVTIWVASTGFLAFVAAIGVAREYGTDEDRESILRLAVANPAILLLRGLPQGASLDQFIFFQIFTYLALMAGLMSTFLAVRHSRTEEETGRAELIASTPAARRTPTTATLIHGIGANIALALLVAGAFMAAGLDAVGALLCGAAAGAAGVAYLTVGLLAAQLFRTSRAANSVSVAVVLSTFLLRGVGDALGTPGDDGLHMTSAWPSWLSPIGWGQHVDAFGTNTPLPLLLQLALVIAVTAAVYALQSSRDSGASLIADSPGRLTAAPAFRSNLALAWRLHRTSVIGWAIGGAACGLFAGSLSSLVRQAADSTPAIGDTLSAISGAGTTLDQALISIMFSIAGVLAAAAAIQSVIRLRQEEAGGTAELLLSTPLSRVRWFADFLVVAVVAVVAVLLSAASVAVVAVIATGSDSSLVGDVAGIAVAQLPAALLFLGALALVFVVAPAWTAGLGWSVLGLTFFVGVFGPLLGLPDAVTHISPFANSPVLIGDEPEWNGGFTMLAVALAAVAASLVLMRRRALRST